jgi:protein-tyrosine phosphatase
VDDGARDFAEALAMLKEARDAGVKTILLTPHVRMDDPADLMDKLEKTFNEIKTVAADGGVDVELKLGAEMMMDTHLPARIRENKKLTMNGRGTHALVETPFMGVPTYAGRVFFEMLTMGVTPVWAHPERCLDVVKNRDILVPYKANGVMFQIDAASLMGKHGWRVKWTAKALLKKGFADIVASDCHRPGDIKNILPQAFSRVSKLLGADRAVELFSSVPMAVAG